MDRQTQIMTIPLGKIGRGVKIVCHKNISYFPVGLHGKKAMTLRANLPDASISLKFSEFDDLLLVSFVFMRAWTWNKRLVDSGPRTRGHIKVIFFPEKLLFPHRFWTPKVLYHSLNHKKSRSLILPFLTMFFNLQVAKISSIETFLTK